MADVSPAADSRPGDVSGMLFGAGEAFALAAYSVSASQVYAYLLKEHRSPPLCLYMHLLSYTTNSPFIQCLEKISSLSGNGCNISMLTQHAKF